VYIFKRIEVVTGVEELGFAEIQPLEDLPANKKIVTKGAFYIFSKMQNIETDD
jgi:cobalt-zinc-cadmium efflux system membrane fusion protein